MNRLKTIIAATAFAALPFNANAQDDNISRHPLSYPENISLHEAYGVVKFIRSIEFLHDKYNGNIAASAMMLELMTGTSIIDDEETLIDQAYGLTRNFYGQYDVGSAMVVCSDVVSHNMIVTVDYIQQDIFGRSVLDAAQLRDVLEQMMQIPPRLHLQLRYAENRQREIGLDPDTAACKTQRLVMGANNFGANGPAIP